MRIFLYFFIFLYCMHYNFCLASLSSELDFEEFIENTTVLVSSDVVLCSGSVVGVYHLTYVNNKKAQVITFGDGTRIVLTDDNLIHSAGKKIETRDSLVVLTAAHCVISENDDGGFSIKSRLIVSWNFDKQKAKYLVNVENSVACFSSIYGTLISKEDNLNSAAYDFAVLLVPIENVEQKPKNFASLVFKEQVERYSRGDAVSVGHPTGTFNVRTTLSLAGLRPCYENDQFLCLLSSSDDSYKGDSGSGVFPRLNEIKGRIIGIVSMMLGRPEIKKFSLKTPVTVVHDFFRFPSTYGVCIENPKNSQGLILENRPWVEKKAHWMFPKQPFPRQEEDDKIANYRKKLSILQEELSTLKSISRNFINMSIVELESDALSSLVAIHSQYCVPEQKFGDLKEMQLLSLVDALDKKCLALYGDLEVLEIDYKDIEVRLDALRQELNYLREKSQKMEVTLDKNIVSLCVKDGLVDKFNDAYHKYLSNFNSLKRVFAEVEKKNRETPESTYKSKYTNKNVVYEQKRKNYYQQIEKWLVETTGILTENERFYLTLDNRLKDALEEKSLNLLFMAIEDGLTLLNNRSNLFSKLQNDGEKKLQLIDDIKEMDKEVYEADIKALNAMRFSDPWFYTEEWCKRGFAQFCVALNEAKIRRRKRFLGYVMQLSSLIGMYYTYTYGRQWYDDVTTYNNITYSDTQREYIDFRFPEFRRVFGLGSMSLLGLLMGFSFSFGENNRDNLIYRD